MNKIITAFEKKHIDESEPWNYSERAAEKLRHLWVRNQVEAHISDDGPLLDVGCSLGQLTGELLTLNKKLYAIDISSAAVQKAYTILKPKFPLIQPENFITGTGLNIPFPNGFFSGVVMSDGIHGWDLNKEEKLLALKEAHRVLKTGGFVFLTDYMHPKYFQDHINLVKETPFKIKSIQYLNDRLWFQIANSFKVLNKFYWFRSLLKNENFARGLAKVSSLVGKRGSKHIAVILVRYRVE